AVAGGLTTAGDMLIRGDFDWETLAKGITSSALGADGQHLTGAVPHGGAPRPHSTFDAPPHHTGSESSAHGGDTTLSQVLDSGADPAARVSGFRRGPGERPHAAPAEGLRGPAPEPARRAGDTAPRRPPDQQSRAYGETRRTEQGRPHDEPRRTDPASRTVRETAGKDGDPAHQGGRENQRRTPDSADRSADDARGRPVGRSDGEITPPSRPGPAGDTGHANRIDRLVNHGQERPRDTHAAALRDAGAHGVAGDGTAQRSAQDQPGPEPAQVRPDRTDTVAAAHDTTPAVRQGQDAPPDGAAQPVTRADEGAGQAHPPADTRPPWPGETPTAADHPGGGRRDRSQVPFEFERFYNDPRWDAEATQFEIRLGAYYFTHPDVVDAARTAVGRLRDALMRLVPRQEGESRADFARRVEGAFFQDEAFDSAGQVGPGVTVDDLLAHGNLRELMTAFYNAAYYNIDHPHTLAKILLDVYDHGRWDEARAAGLDVEELRRMQRQLDESPTRAAAARIESLISSGDPRFHRFARDPFATANVIMLSERGLRDLAEVVSSQKGRRARTEEEMREFITTPRYYEEVGAPLGRFERAFIESREGPLRPDSPLPWREGRTAHATTDSRWARKNMDDGLPVVDGVSATTARMLTAAKYLNLGDRTIQHFLSGLMGWMLPGRDHSMFEIVRGAQIAGVHRVDFAPGDRPGAVDFYRSLTDLDLHTLRTRVLPDGMFPHEALYLRNVDVFSETRHPKVRDIADHMWPQLERGRVTDPALADWLRRNGIDPADADAVRGLGERLSKAHVMALTVYTRHSHYLINNVTRTHLWTGGVSETTVRTMMGHKAQQLVKNYLSNLAAGTKALPLPMALRPLLHVGDGHLDSRSPLDAPARAWVDGARRTEEAKQRLQEHKAAGRSEEVQRAEAEVREARRAQREAWREIERRLADAVPGLFEEMRWHADMVHDAMTQLPAVGSPEHPQYAYRGDWITPVYSPIYGSKLFPHGTAREFLSVSRLLEVAIRFMAENPAGDRKVLVVYELTGHQAREISVFSSFAEDQEAVFPPHSRTVRVEDPQLADQVRAEVEETARDMVRRGVIPEVPDRYEVIVMKEDPR
ncbi:MAG: hypothetical protein IRY84_11470, partial [Thermobispora bispora]|nr:hypothetical protein [Thermobispora bispora]